MVDVTATSLSRFRTVGNRVAEGCSKDAEQGQAPVFLTRVGNGGRLYVRRCVFVERRRSHWLALEVTAENRNLPPRGSHSSEGRWEDPHVG